MLCFLIFAFFFDEFLPFMPDKAKNLTFYQMFLFLTLFGM